MLSSIVFFKECIKQINKSSSSIQNFYISKGVCESALKALEKQQPVRVDYEGDGYSDGQLVYDTWICPNCGQRYEVDYDNYNYCPNCGQHIDLSN